MNFCKKTISILLLFVLLSGIGVKSIITFHYFINQTEIVELFCINKEKPQLQCNGKCHLAQELKEIDVNDDELPFLPVQLSFNSELTFIIAAINVNFSTLNTIKNKNFSPFLRKTITPFFSITTPPPQQIA